MKLQELRNQNIININKLVDDNKKSKIIETSIYDYCINECGNNRIENDNSLFNSLYLYQVNNIIANLDPTSRIQNTQLLPKIKENQFDISLIGGMSLIFEHQKIAVDYLSTHFDSIKQRWVDYTVDQARENPTLLATLLQKLMSRSQPGETPSPVPEQTETPSQSLSPALGLQSP